MLTLDEAELLLSILRALDAEVEKRDSGLTMTHEVGQVSLTLRTDRARHLAAVIRRLANDIPAPLRVGRQEEGRPVGDDMDPIRIALDYEREEGTRLGVLARDVLRLREALAFYADADSYFALALVPDMPCGPFYWDLDDSSELHGLRLGAWARAALRGEDFEPAFDFDDFARLHPQWVDEPQG